MALLGPLIINMANLECVMKLVMLLRGGGELQALGLGDRSHCLVMLLLLLLLGWVEMERLGL